jgi:hypothetical protein
MMKFKLGEPRDEDLVCAAGNWSYRHVSSLRFSPRDFDWRLALPRSTTRPQNPANATSELDCIRTELSRTKLRQIRVECFRKIIT